MNRIKVLILEDEAIIAMDLEMMLQEMGYEVVGVATTYEQAVDIFSQQQPDLALLDIYLKNSKPGTEFAKHISGKIPFIFLSSYSDAQTLEQAKQTHPGAYLVKPFKKGDIFAAIEVALSNFSAGKPDEQIEKALFNDCLFVKGKVGFVKLPIKEVIYLSSDKNYLEIVSSKGKFVIRHALSDMLEELAGKPFIRVHKSFVVNAEHISQIKYDEIEMSNGQSVPIGRAYKEQLLNKIKILS